MFDRGSLALACCQSVSSVLDYWGLKELMLTRDQAQEILRTLQMLPAEKLAEVYDYITFLRERYGKSRSVDVNDAWSDEDINELIAASLTHGEQTAWAGET